MGLEKFGGIPVGQSAVFAQDRDDNPQPVGEAFPLPVKQSGSGVIVYDGYIDVPAGDNPELFVEFPVPQEAQAQALYVLNVVNPAAETIYARVYNRETFDEQAHYSLVIPQGPLETMDPVWPDVGRAFTYQGWLVAEAGRIGIKAPFTVPAGGVRVWLRVRKV